MIANKLMTFAKNQSPAFLSATSGTEQNPWQLLVVDDDQAIHDVTKLILFDYQFEQRPLQLTHAYSAQQAKDLLSTNNFFAVMLLDVVMESDHAGLDLVNYIRKTLKNQFLRIILRTGQPGQAPEMRVMMDYDINDYRDKSELTANKMCSSVTAALRSFQDINTIQSLVFVKEKLQQQVTHRNTELEQTNIQLRNEIAARSIIEKELDITNDKLASIINNSSALISLKNINGQYDLVNNAFAEHLKLRDTDIIGKTDFELFDYDVAIAINYNDQEVIASGKATQCEEILPTNDGEHFHLCIKFPLFDDLGIIYRVCSICTDISDRLEAQNQLLHLAQYDPLTDLPNRSLFIDRVAQVISRTHWHQFHIAVLFIDLDRFKVINDTLGHDVGDKLLIGVATRLKQLVREGDSVCRLGGDEFALLLTELASQSDIVRMVDKVMSSLSKPYCINNNELTVTPSIGISRCPLDGETVNVLLKKADVAMYKAKKSGRNDYRFYLKEDDTKANELLNMELELGKMNEQKDLQLFLVYQPKVNIQTGELDGLEALIRWQHPDKGIISPVDFIPLLEETGLIIDVGEWVLMQACKFAVTLAASDRPIKVAVNLSPRQFKQNNLIATLEQVLQCTGCQPQWLELELTEGALVEDFQRTKETLQRIANMGISLAIDDFGTGYSSLNYLKNLPFNTLKIDRSFITDAPNIKQDRAIVTTIIQLADNLGMSVVAEGVETAEQYHLLKQLNNNIGSHQIQGYIFSKPVRQQQLPMLISQVKSLWQQLERTFEENN